MHAAAYSGFASIARSAELHFADQRFHSDEKFRSESARVKSCKNSLHKKFWHLLMSGNVAFLVSCRLGAKICHSLFSEDFDSFAGHLFQIEILNGLF